MGGGSDSKQNPEKTFDSKNKEEKKDRKAEVAGQLTRAQKSAAGRSS